MTVLPIVIHGNPILHRPAAPVTSFDDKLRKLIDDMYETQEVSNGVGLAAPQVGVGLRLFTYKFENEDGVPPLGVVVNPVLTLGKISTADPDPYDEVEGCLSFPGYSFPLKRADWVTVNGFDGEGNPLKFEATGWFARVMQHETDHLDGKLYVNRLNAKYTKKYKKVVKAEGWTAEGNTWMPGVDPDPFGHGE
ncbi:peptide deformylase [Rothia sp. SD9660Na]|uniref:peptide deformylase n=1 Tax=Rothia sp. SD9660Na TaxID=3047030 RepID=UPI0024BAF6F6|nr:peptide deformylase [Rothia sp. SD9660Na]WHS51292.1 peptide deformylase [Rothia sp. SD9660Na]